MENEISIYAFLTEMETWFHFDKQVKEDAMLLDLSGIEPDDYEELEQTYNDWSDGKYDDDPEYVRDIILKIINKNNG